MNQVRGPADVAIGHQLVTACARHLGIRAAYAGFVYYDDAVWQARPPAPAVRRPRPRAAAPPQKRAPLARGLLDASEPACRFDWLSEP